MVVSFSGGKDSTVLLHLVREEYPGVRAVFSNTGLEYPEIQRFVKSFDNVDIITPAMRFDTVLSTYGYPLISKEVAEAIYYARRIRSHSGHVEREREREREREPNRPKEKGRTVRTEATRGIHGVHRASNRESANPPTEKYSYRDKHCSKPANRSDGRIGGYSGDRLEESPNQREDSLNRNKGRAAKSRGDTDWSNWRRGCL